MSNARDARIYRPNIYECQFRNENFRELVLTILQNAVADYKHLARHGKLSAYDGSYNCRGVREQEKCYLLQFQSSSLCKWYCDVVGVQHTKYKAICDKYKMEYEEKWTS